MRIDRDERGFAADGLDEKLSIFNALGREIEVLVNETLTSGTYSLTFDGSDYNSGVYFYKLVSDNFNESKKMLLLK
ncbi:MAG: T9SS type A sorting domain-containing protein [Ignavibacteria bacterium]|nr:T9SS type A sorting domain-containing protein [Ignavibacteria bacterium]